jgi:dTDP-4-amino-4,6-dideoxygalactose transaminase
MATLELVAGRALPNTDGLRLHKGPDPGGRIPFTRPAIIGAELAAIGDALTRPDLTGAGHYSRLCEERFARELGVARTFLTPSCTHSLEMAAMLLRLEPGDEVIVPSFTFVSTANAFVLCGATIVFVDIRPDTMNIDETRIEAAITPRTRAIVPVHYGGVAAEMDVILDLAQRYRLKVIEDAAQGVAASYRGRPLGSMGHFGAFSFHATKNLTSGGEGGLTIVRDQADVAAAEICRDKGTNRSRFCRGEVDKYTWLEIGSSLLMNEVSAACLWAQLEAMNAIQARRHALYSRYSSAFSELVEAGRIEVQHLPAHILHNAHLFYIKLRDADERAALTRFLDHRGIAATFHYVPLHSSPAGRIHGRFSGADLYTTRESQRLLRLPLYHDLAEGEQDRVIDAVLAFFARS